MLTPVARISGTKEKRPELDRLMQDAHRRRFDVVAVWKFDRMARSVSHLLRVLETFDALGIHFVSLSEAINTATPAGKLVFTVLGAVAELERSLIVERVKAGLRNARAQGKRLGRPRVIVDVVRISVLRASVLMVGNCSADRLDERDCTTSLLRAERLSTFAQKRLVRIWARGQDSFAYGNETAPSGAARQTCEHYEHQLYLPAGSPNLS